MKHFILSLVATVAVAASSNLNEAYAADTSPASVSSQTARVANGPIAYDRHFQVLYEDHHHHWNVYATYATYATFHQAKHASHDLRHRGYRVRVRAI